MAANCTRIVYNRCATSNGLAVVGKDSFWFRPWWEAAGPVHPGMVRQDDGTVLNFDKAPGAIGQLGPRGTRMIIASSAQDRVDASIEPLHTVTRLLARER